MQFDEKKLLEHFDDDKEMISELVAVFEETYLASLSALKVGIAAQNYKDVHLHAHTIKGMVSNFFSPALSEAALALETMGKNEDTIGHENPLSQIEAGIPLLIQELKDYCG